MCLRVHVLTASGLRDAVLVGDRLVRDDFRLVAWTEDGVRLRHTPARKRVGDAFCTVLMKDAEYAFCVKEGDPEERVHRVPHADVVSVDDLLQKKDAEETARALEEETRDDAAEVMRNGAAHVLRDDAAHVLRDDAAQGMRDDAAQGMRDDAAQVMRDDAAQGMRNDAAQVMRDDAAQVMRDDAAQVMRNDAAQGMRNDAAQGMRDDAAQVMRDDAEGTRDDAEGTRDDAEGTRDDAEGTRDDAAEEEEAFPIVRLRFRDAQEEAVPIVRLRMRDDAQEGVLRTVRLLLRGKVPKKLSHRVTPVVLRKRTAVCYTEDNTTFADTFFGVRLRMCGRDTEHDDACATEHDDACATEHDDACATEHEDACDKEGDKECGDAYILPPKKRKREVYDVDAESCDEDVVPYAPEELSPALVAATPHFVPGVTRAADGTYRVGGVKTRHPFVANVIGHATRTDASIIDPAAWIRTQVVG